MIALFLFMGVKIISDNRYCFFWSRKYDTELDIAPGGIDPLGPRLLLLLCNRFPIETLSIKLIFVCKNILGDI